MYKSLIFPFLARMEAETAHERALRLLEWGQRGWRRPFLQKLTGNIPQKTVSLWGLTFPNVLGMAAGFDKEVRVAEGLALLRTLTRANWQFSQQFKVRRRPLLVKIAPDLTWPELDEILTAVQDTLIDGLIAANTTTSRAGLTDPAQTESGGLSGRPLRRHSTEIIAYIHKQTGGKLPVIGVGGAASAADVQEKLAAGASLAQLYTAFIYEGPRLPGRILRRLPQLPIAR